MSSRLCAVSNIPAIGNDAELILPCQYYQVSGGERMTGEQRLMFALLVDAINVYQRGVTAVSTPAKRLYVDAERWIMAYRLMPGALSFETACEAVGIDGARLRRRLIAWKHSLRRQHLLQTRLRLSVRRGPSPRRRHALRHDRIFIPM